MPNQYSVNDFVTKQGLISPDIVTKQGVLESGHFKSYNCIERNNLFGLRSRNNVSDSNKYGYYSYNHWTESVIHYKKCISSKHRIGETYYKFLERLGYAEDSTYIYKLKNM